MTFWWIVGGLLGVCGLALLGVLIWLLKAQRDVIVADNDYIHALKDFNGTLKALHAVYREAWTANDSYIALLEAENRQFRQIRVGAVCPDCQSVYGVHRVDCPQRAAS